MLLAALLALNAPAAPACLDVRGGDAPVLLEGQLERHVYPGPPNYESIRHGDRAVPTHILVLDRPICIDDGDEFADPTVRFNRVQIFESEEGNWLRLRMRAAVGHRIRIRGIGFASFTVHHNAPLVVRITQISIQGR